MEFGLADGLQATLPRIILYLFLGTWVAWLYHLVRPALEAAFASDYRKFSWVSEKRGVGSFLKSTWDVAFKSTEVFAGIHRKVKPPKKKRTKQLRWWTYINGCNRSSVLSMTISILFQSHIAAMVSCSWYQKYCSMSMSASLTMIFLSRNIRYNHSCQTTRHWVRIS